MRSSSRACGLTAFAVDSVVTGWGIATLRARTVRQRIGELVAVAHPDCRPQLKEAAARLYGWNP